MSSAALYIDSKKAGTDPVIDELIESKELKLSILRLDKLHPIISGNKFFKLKYYLEDAASLSKPVLTFGGGYSNHLAATAAACKIINVACIGIVRGDYQPLTHTLQFCKEQGMELQPVSNEKYKTLTSNEASASLFPDHVVISEGGYGARGVKGSAEIAELFDPIEYDYICSTIGTGTTLAGIIKASNEKQKVIGFSALKHFTDIHSRLHHLLGKTPANYIIKEYPFGGYAKWNNTLINFMNGFYAKHGIPTDFVYTGKMMFGVMDLIKNDFFSTGSKILCIHSGGLQGNQSLPEGSLNFNLI